MTTFIADRHERRIAELEENTRTAWAAYKDRLEGLDGADYDAAEDDAWEQLQTRLRRYERQLAELAALDQTARG